MIIAGFLIQDELGNVRFFEGTFLLADSSMHIVLVMPFLSLRNADIQFDMENLIWRIYSIAEALPTTRQVQLTNKHKFARAILNKNSQTFIIDVVGVYTLEVAIHPSRAPLLAALQQDKALTKIHLEYVNYANVFSLDLAMELPKNTGINKQVIELIEGKQPPYGPTYCLGPVELGTLKAYIETYLKNGFIKSKSPVKTPILVGKKPDASLQLCVDYRGLNNLTIKNRYLLPLIGKSLDWLGRAKRFNQLDLTSAYHQM